MKISDKQKKQAAELMAKLNCKELFINEKGEFFTNKSLAAYSVEGDKSRYADVSSFQGQSTPKGENTAEELIAIVSEATTVEAVKAISKLENDRSKPRKTVLAACDSKIEELNETED